MAPSIRASSRRSREARVVVAAAAAGTIALRLVCGSAAATVQNVASVPLTIEAALGARTLPVTTRVLAASPDGRRVAFVTQDLARARGEAAAGTALFTRSGNVSAMAGCDLWLLDTRTGRARLLTAKHRSSWGPAWSPDGRRLAFYSDRLGTLSLWIWDAEHGSRRLIETRARPAHGWELPTWSPDGSRILFKAAIDPESVGPSGVPSPAPDVRVFTSPAAQSDASSTQAPADPAMRAARADLVEVDWRTRRLQRLARGHAPTWYRYAPDGRSIALVSIRGRLSNSSTLVYNLRLIERRTRDDRVLAEGLQLGFPATGISWSPRGDRLAFVGRLGPGADGVWLVPTADSGPERLPAPPDIRVEAGFRAPLWARSGDVILAIGSRAHPNDVLMRVNVHGRDATALTLPGATRAVALLGAHGPQTGGSGDTVHVRTFDAESKATGIWRAHLDTGALSRVFEEDTAFGSHGMLSQAALTGDLAQDGSRYIYTAETAASAPVISDVRLDDGVRRTLYSVNEPRASLVPGRSRLVTFQTASGRTLHAALLLPAAMKPGERYPLIVHLYAARGSDNLNRFGLVSAGIGNMQLLATRGFAVLFPDIADHPGDPAAALTDSIPAAVRAVVDMGIADPARIGLIGHSYGAYSTVLLLTRTNIFSAAVARGGYYNTFAQYGRLGSDGAAVWTAILEGGIGRGMDPWRAREAFLSQGPIFHLDTITTPLLLIHGGADDAAAATESEQLFVGLRRLGKTVEYARYEGEEHYEGRWSPRSQADYLSRMIAWFERHVRDRRPTGP